MSLPSFHRLPPLRARAAALLAILLTLPAAWPFLVAEGYWVSHDGLFHLYRLLSLESAWRVGHFYPRLFPDFAFGYGFAVLNFYGPLTYYTALALSALLPALVAVKATFALSYPLAALAVWWLARDLWRRDEAANEGAGLVAAAAYTYVPYHMADVQLRGALAESWAFVWTPLLFWALWRARPWPLALSLAALVLTHNLSVVLVALPLAAWAFVGPHALSPARRLRALVGGGGLAALLSAFYWLPVLLESRWVGIAQDVGGQGFARHLAPLSQWVAPSATYRYFPEQGVAGEHPLSWAQVALLAAALVTLPAVWRGLWAARLRFWWGLLGLSLLLLLPLSLPLWQALRFPFGLVQYPWRWLALTALATAMLASSLLAPPLAAGNARVRALLLMVLLAWLAASSLQHLPWAPRTVEVARHPVPMWQEDAAAGQVGATWTAEFLPLTVQEQRWALARAPEQVPDVGERTPLRVRRAGSDGFLFWAEVEGESGGWLTFPRFAYPSMQAKVDGVKAPIVARGELGLASVALPAGQHHVTLAAEPLATMPWLGTILALAALLTGGAALIRQGRTGAGIALGLLLLAGVAWLVRSPSGADAPLAAPVTIGEQVQLLGVTSRGKAAQAGSSQALTLLWFNLERTRESYITFLHLTAPGGGNPLAQHDSEPNMGTVPTSRWLAGQVVEDLHLLDIPPDLAAGRYELWAGIYALTDGEARPLPGDSSGRYLVGTLEVVSP